MLRCEIRQAADAQTCLRLGSTHGFAFPIADEVEINPLNFFVPAGRHLVRVDPGSGTLSVKVNVRAHVAELAERGMCDHGGTHPKANTQGTHLPVETVVNNVRCLHTLFSLGYWDIRLDCCELVGDCTTLV